MSALNEISERKKLPFAYDLQQLAEEYSAPELMASAIGRITVGEDHLFNPRTVSFGIEKREFIKRLFNQANEIHVSPLMLVATLITEEDEMLESFGKKYYGDEVLRYFLDRSVDAQIAKQEDAFKDYQAGRVHSGNYSADFEANGANAEGFNIAQLKRFQRKLRQKVSTSRSAERK